MQAAIALLIAGVLVVLGCAWRSERRERANLEQQLRAANTTIAQAEQRQKSRDAAVDQAIAALEKKKHAVTTTQQIVSQLPLDLHLPVPLQIEPTPETYKNSAATSPPMPYATAPSTSNPAAQGSSHRVVLPTDDLKPLYDFTVDCQECKARLDAAQQDLADERAKSAALTQQRDAAAKAANGGTLVHRIGRAAKWLLIGAAAGAIAAEAAHPR